VAQVSDAVVFVAQLRRVVGVECRAWNQIVRNNVDDAGPPSSALEQLHLLTGLFSLSINQSINQSELAELLQG